MRTKCLLINAYSARNAGDAAIMLGTIALLRDTGITDVALASRHRAEDADFYLGHGVRVVSPPIPFPPRGRLPSVLRALILALGVLRGLLVAATFRFHRATGLMIGRMFRAGGTLEVLGADKIVIAGGGYMYSSKRRFNLTLFHEMMCIIVPIVAGRAIVMMPQSIGPLTRRADRALVSRVLRHVRPVMAREPLAFAETVGLLGSSHDIHLCPDVAFYGWPSECQRDDVLSRDSFVVGIVAMDWTWARIDGPVSLDRYCEKLAQFATMNAQRGHEVVFCAHSFMPEQEQVDIEIAHRVMGLIPEACRARCRIAEDARSPESLRAIYASCDVVVGTRLHSCILAMLEGTPAIALAYQPKAIGTYSMVGLSDLCFTADDFDVLSLQVLVDALEKDPSAGRARIGASVTDARNTIVRSYSGLLG